MKETLLQRCQREALEEYQKRYILNDESLIETLNKIITHTLKQAAEEIGKMEKPETCPKYPNGNGACNQRDCEFCRDKESESRDGYNQALTDAQKLLLGEDNENV